MKIALIKGATMMLLCTVGFLSHAVPKTGDPLPAFVVDDKGQMQLKGEEITYAPFDSATVKGKTTVLLLIAAGVSPDTLDELFKALSAKTAANGKQKVFNILGFDQAVWGTKGIALGHLKDQQKAFPAFNFVVDASGIARSSLGLSAKGYAVIVIDASGRVTAAKDGATNKAEIEAFLGEHLNGS